MLAFLRAARLPAAHAGAFGALSAGGLGASYFGGSAALCSATDSTAMPEVLLYQYDTCPFCNKVKAFLDLHNVAYRVVEVNPLTKAEAKAVSDYKMVPFAFVDGAEVRESANIIEHIAALLPEGEGVAPSDGSEEEARWSAWVDDKLVHILPANIYRTPSEALQAFDYISENSNFSAGQQLMAKYSGAVIMYALTQLKLKKKYGIPDDGERQALYDAVTEWTSTLQGRSFLGGDAPNLADVSVFGVLRSLEGYPTFDDMLANTDVQSWYERMTAVVGTSARKELSSEQ